MKKNDRSPKARRSQLVIKELASETLVYDERNHQAHCLNQTAVFVWKHCDGRTNVSALARLLNEEIDASAPEQVVRLAIRQLDQSHLLETSSPASGWLLQTSRRELIRTFGVAAVALPIIISVVAPTAAAAASCKTRGQPCTGPGLGNCCPGMGLVCQGIGPTCQVT